MGDREVATKRGQAPFVEDLADHPEILVEEDLVSIAHRDPGRFLAAVLEGEEAERGDRGRLGTRSRRQRGAEHAAHQLAAPFEAAVAGAGAEVSHPSDRARP